ncbi:hypothetical protein [Telmatospirillum sp.]|uniref:hypothetical protein n=1 Tax=Telmatospirillum sp. TaxID=2079197 RepID=UPI00284D0112|nr:hypothetical protein [Telmatospirillum sp.]MDR3436538.1 hypothetical protein [Telmatospirillum sp.]
MVTLESTVRLFRRLDRLFWLVWLAYPATIWIAVCDALDVSGIRSLMKSDPAGCVESLPIPANFSLSGKILYGCLYASTQVFFVTMLIVVHLAIKRFAKDQIFVLRTLESVRSLGLLIAGWGVYESIYTNFLVYGLYLTGAQSRPGKIGQGG